MLPMHWLPPATRCKQSPNTYDDGPVLGSALAVLDGDVVVATVLLPEPDGRVAKVEGLALLEWDDDGGVPDRVEAEAVNSGCSTRTRSTKCWST